VLLEANVGGLALDPASNTPMVILECASKGKSFPIWIGVFEASAIASQMEGVDVPRPMTHDLFAQSLQTMGIALTEVAITELKQNTFFAELKLQDQQGNVKVVDARPSDALALALRFRAKIMVEEAVVEAADALPTTSHRERLPTRSKDLTKEKWEELLKNLSDEAFGKYKM
jgi:hypothetical protein